MLFDINYEMSVLDMLLAFVGFVKKYRVVKFTRPIISKNDEKILVEGLKTIWTKENKFKISDETNLKIKDSKKIVIFQKTPNSF